MEQSVIKELSMPELLERIQEENASLLRQKLNHAVSPIASPMKIRESRRTIAKLKTELRARQLKSN